MDKKDKYQSRNSSVQRKLDSKRNYTMRRNLEKQHKRTRSLERIKKKENGQAQKDNGVVYIEEKIYTPNNQNI